MQRTYASGETAWRARYVDPDTGLRVWERLEASLSTYEARRAWAMQKSHALSQRRAALASGAPLRTETLFGEAIDSFYEAAAHRLAESTLTNYQHRIERFRQWGQASGIKHTESLNLARLRAFRETLVASGRHVVVRGGKRGLRTASAAKRSAVTTNSYLKCTKILLNHWRALGLVPDLTRDSICDALKVLPVPREQPEYLHASEIGQLIDAALRHDAAMYAETRQEHAGRRTVGTTPRYTPIAPFLVVLLLTGCRRGEALALRWSHLDLGALDQAGRKVGEIRLRAGLVKTKHARTIGMEVSPGLRRLLAALKLRAAPDDEVVFGGKDAYTAHLVTAARRRLVSEFGAPRFSWKLLRSTCATYLTCSTGIWGSATLWLSAKQLGHSVTVAERHYLGVHRGIPRTARTLEAAMQVQRHLSEVVVAVQRGLRVVRAG